MGVKSSGVKPRERDSPSISLVGSVASPFSVQNQHPKSDRVKYHCEKCGIPLHHRESKPSRYEMRQQGKPILCHKCSARENGKKRNQHPTLEMKT